MVTMIKISYCGSHAVIINNKTDEVQKKKEKGRKQERTKYRYLSESGTVKRLEGPRTLDVKTHASLCLTLDHVEVRCSFMDPVQCDTSRSHLTYIHMCVHSCSSFGQALTAQSELGHGITRETRTAAALTFLVYVGLYVKYYDPPRGHVFATLSLVFVVSFFPLPPLLYDAPHRKFRRVISLNFERQNTNWNFSKSLEK